jgi:hypothetical protein
VPHVEVSAEWLVRIPESSQASQILLHTCRWHVAKRILLYVCAMEHAKSRIQGWSRYRNVFTSRAEERRRLHNLLKRSVALVLSHKYQCLCLLFIAVVYCSAAILTSSGTSTSHGYRMEDYPDGDHYSLLMHPKPPQEGARHLDACARGVLETELNHTCCSGHFSCGPSLHSIPCNRYFWKLTTFSRSVQHRLHVFASCITYCSLF